MTTWPFTEIGIPLDQVDTPALLLDLDTLERNLERMKKTVSGTSVSLRPHAKTHKSPMIALRQIALGAVGVCCQKVSEAEIMIHGGVQNVLVTNEIVGAPKLVRLAALAKQAHIAVCVDDPGNIRNLDQVALSFGVRLSVLVEINVGEDRCGVEPGEPAVALARQIAQSSGLRFVGIQAYHGAAQHERAFEARKERIQLAVQKASRTVELLKRNGLACAIVSGGGTGTYLFEMQSGVYTEIQPGSYIFMDVDYGKNLQQNGENFRDFEHALFVYTTVMSRPARDRAIVDAGLKAVSVDSGMPLVYEMPDVEFVGAGDEHGKLRLHDPNRALQIGDKVHLVPGHCDPTVNLFDWYVGVRHGRVEAIWPVAARGAVQ